MVPLENATNLMDCKEIKRNCCKKRREKLEYLETTEMIEGKHSREKQHEKMLDGLTKWLKVGRVIGAVKVMKDRGTWKVMIAYAKEHDV